MSLKFSNMSHFMGRQFPAMHKRESVLYTRVHGLICQLILILVFTKCTTYTISHDLHRILRMYTIHSIYLQEIAF